MDLSRIGRLKSRWDDLRYGFLFFPGLIAMGFVALAFLVVWIDRLGGTHGLGFGFGGDASAGRTVLSTIASSLITVAGLTFSITIVSLQLVSQQFTPRALRNFLGDGLNQTVAGCFVGIFAYCLLVLRTIRDGSDASPTFDGFVPALAVTLAIVLGILTLGLLLVFIHHMSRSIQVSTIASKIGRATLEAVDDLYPEELGNTGEDQAEELVRKWRHEPAPVVVRPNRPGYVQTVALDEILGSGDHERCKIHICVAPGDFVTPATPVAEAWAPSGDAARAGETLSALITVENERDPGQDVLYGIRQLTDIAVRALSPSMNDPTTAITCLGYTQAVLERLAGRALPSRVRRADSLQVVARRREFEEFAAVGLGQVAHHADGEPRVVAALLQCVESVERSARRAGAHDRVAVLEEVVAELRESADPTSAGGRRTSAPAASGSLPR
jgi:uncharacterized membrane protein